MVAAVDGMTTTLAVVLGQGHHLCGAAATINTPGGAVGVRENQIKLSRLKLYHNHATMFIV